MKKYYFLNTFVLFAFFSIQLKASNPVISVSEEPTQSQVLNSDQNGMNLQFHFGDINTINIKNRNGRFH